MKEIIGKNKLHAKNIPMQLTINEKMSTTSSKNIKKVNHHILNIRN